ncbi:MAG: hypothetical protein AB1798_11560 [Spirochaetota bacterium]
MKKQIFLFENAIRLTRQPCIPLIGETEVTYELWSKVYTWAAANRYSFANTLGLNEVSGMRQARIL